MTSRSVALVLALLGVPVFLAAEPPLAPATPPAEGLAHFGDSVSVALASVRTRILDPAGEPIPELKPEQVKVQVGTHDVPVVAVDYYDNSVAPGDLPDDGGPAAAAGTKGYVPLRVSARGQLFVFFVEGDAMDKRTSADKLATFKKMVEALKPTDLAAVISLDRQLRLQQDFTLDRAAILQAILRGRQMQDAPASATRPGPLSLARSWDAQAARKTTHTETAFARLAAALDPLPGEKVVVALSRGQGHFAPPVGGVRRLTLTAEFQATIRALQMARAEVFVLDDPREGLMKLAKRDPINTPDPLPAILFRVLANATGGTYASAQEDANTDRLIRTTRGYHLVTVNLEQLATKDRSMPLTVSLVGRPGVVLTQPLFVVNSKG